MDIFVFTQPSGQTISIFMVKNGGFWKNSLRNVPLQDYNSGYNSCKYRQSSRPL